MIREGRLRYFKQQFELEFPPQFFNRLRLLCRRCSSSETKACTFFRQAFSARNRCTPAIKSSSICPSGLGGRPAPLRPRRSAYSPPALFQIDSFPFPYPIFCYIGLPLCFLAAKPAPPHHFYHMLFEFPGVSFARYSFWYENTPKVISVYHTV
jgi:hypothetical protein